MTTILILAVVGILAVLAELVLPGGLLGVIGSLCLLGAVIATYVEYGATAGTIALAVLVAIGFIALTLWMKFFHRLPFTRQLVLHDEAGVDHEREDRPSLVGQKGTALTDLYPSGKASIGEDKIDVLSEGALIAKGSLIEVVEERGPSIIVREIREGG
jgi:membrane-bound serine protease (ClpP class)